MLIPTFIVSTWFLNCRTIPWVSKNGIYFKFLTFVSYMYITKEITGKFLNKHYFVLHCYIILITLNITILGTEICTERYGSRLLRDSNRIFLYRSFLKHRPIFDYLSFVLKLCIELDPTERMNERTRNGIFLRLSHPSRYHNVTARNSLWLPKDFTPACAFFRLQKKYCHYYQTVIALLNASLKITLNFLSARLSPSSNW